MILKIVQFLAIILTALATVPSGAHFFELPNKIALAEEQYFVVQSIYRGWALFGIVIIGALVANLVLAIMLRGQGGAFRLAVVAFLCIGASLAVFFIWTFPANQATDNWTTVPADWDVLRAQWEYSHAVNAIIVFIGLCAVTLSTLLTRERP